MPQRERILVIDDNKTTLHAIEMSLEARDYEVDATDTVEEGIRLLQQRDYAVAIIDINFLGSFTGPNPEQAGMLILKEALRKPRIEAILMTAYENLDTAIQAVRSGAFDYIEKGPRKDDPYFLTRIADAVEKALATRQVHYALEDALNELHKCLAAMRRTGLTVPEFDDAQNALFLANNAYKRLQSTRGKSPDPHKN